MAEIRIGGAFLDFFSRNAQFIAGMQRNATALRRQQRAVNTLRREVRGFNRSARTMVASIFSLRGALVGLLGVGGLLQFGSVLIEMADTMVLASARLRLVIRGTEEYNLVQRELFAISQEARQPLSNLVDLYARVGRATVQLGKNHEDLLPFVRAVAQAIVTSGANAQEARAGLIQFSQGLASGRLAGDEFRSVAEQVPRLAQAIANGLGLTIGQLRELAHDQRLTTEVIFESLSSQYAVLQSEIDSLPRTVSQALVQVQNQFLFTIQQVNTTTNATQGLVDAIDRFRLAVARPDLIMGFIGLLQQFVSTLATLLENLDLVAHAFAVTFGLAVLHSRIGRIAAAVLRVGVSMLSLRGAVAATAQSFLVFYTLPARALRSVSEQIVLLRVRLSIAGDHVRAFGQRFAAAMRHPIASIQSLVTRLRTLRNNISVIAIAARTTFATAMVAAAAATRIFTTAVRLAGRAIRFLSPLIIVEGLIQVVNFIRYTGEELRKFGGLWKDVAVVAAVDFVQFLVRGIIRVPGILIQIMAAAMEGVRQVVISGAQGVGAAFAAIFSFENPLTAFAAEFEGAIGRAYEAAGQAFSEENVFTQLADSVQFSDTVLRAYGLDEEGIRNLRGALRNAGGRVLQDLKNLFSIEIPEASATAGGAIASNIQKGVDTTKESISRLSDSVRTIQRAFSTFAFDVLDDFTQIGHAASRLAVRLRNELLEVLVFRQIFSRLSGFVAGSLGLPVQAPQARQGGGFTPPGLTLVGEGGPELVDFRRPGQVYTNDALSAALRGSGGTVINITQNIAPGVNAAQVTQAIAQSYPQLRDAITQHVERATARRRS